MRFSDRFKIKRSKTDTWFDPVLSVDTLLFIDPFLIYDQEQGIFRGSHKEIIRFFDSVFKLIARSRGDKSSLFYKKAVDTLMFPEREELCLGFTEGGTKGSGSGRDLANTMAAAIWEAIQAGLTEITHFEAVAILREGIGSDRISDITAGLLLKRLATYTEKICRRHKIPLMNAKYTRGWYDTAKERWQPLKVRSPRNPYNDKPILLIPEEYLAVLPTLNPEDFWEYCYENQNESLRNEFSYDVSRHVSKHDIIELARRHVDFVAEYVEYRERRRPRAYNLRRDEKGLVRWYDASKQYVAKHPLAISISSPSEFPEMVTHIIEEFRHFVEENAGWKLLWNDNQTSRSEKVAQLLFLGIVKHYCQANDIDISPEPNIGRGPVDFKVAQGYQYRALLELKLARNSKFWRGLRRQLPTYLKAEKTKVGHFIVVVYSDADQKRIAGIRRAVKETNKSANFQIVVTVVDAAADKMSASNL